MLKRVLIETQFLPSLEFFCALLEFDQIEIEHYEHYVKQSFRNHTIINTANGLHKLVVPLASKGNRTHIKDVKIDYSLNRMNNFWRTIESAYRKSPYYEHYAEDLQHELFKRKEFLVELNLDLLELSLKWLRWEKKIVASGEYNKTPIIPDLRNVLISKKPYGLRNFYKPVPYTQVFGTGFVENLSIMDLIFCKGPEAGGIIKASRLNL
jgi:hypothetical protein